MLIVGSRVFERLAKLSGLSKLGLVAGGYLAALALAALALVAHVMATSGPDRDASSGMHALGDALVFIVAFALASVVPSGLALHFLRASTWAWPVFSGLGLTVAATGLVAIASLHAPQLQATFGSALAIPRIFVAPLFVALFTFVGLFSPRQASRRGLYAAAAVECCTATYGFVRWLLPLLLPEGR